MGEMQCFCQRFDRMFFTIFTFMVFGLQYTNDIIRMTFLTQNRIPAQSVTDFTTKRLIIFQEICTILIIMNFQNRNRCRF